MRIRQSSAMVGAVIGVLWGAAVAAQPFVYVADLGSDDVNVIDAASLRPVRTLPFADDPDGIAVSPDGRRVYVSGFLSDTVGMIDAETHQLLGTVAVGSGPVGLAVTPDGERVYVTQRGADSVAAIAVANGTVAAVIPVGRGPNAIAITPDGRTAFITNSFAPRAGEVSVLDLASDSVRASIAVARKPNRVAITPDGRTAYVTNFRSWTSTAIDVASETVRTTFRAGLKSTAVAVNPNGAWAYVSDGRSGDLLIIDVALDQVTRAIPLGTAPSGIGLLRNGGTGYVSDFAEDSVHVVDLGEEEPLADVAVGHRPFAVAANCVGDGCSETPYTPKPTRTATDTPTPTPTPTRTSTPTATATASPTRTLESGRSHVLFALTADPTTAGEATHLSLTLQPGGQMVTGLREQVALPSGVTVVDVGTGLECAPAPGIAAAGADFAVVFADCGSGCATLTVAIDFEQPVSEPVDVYTCTLRVAPFAPIGTLRLRHLDNTALDADGGSLPSRGRDGVLVVAPPATSSPDLTPRPTRTPTPGATPDVFVSGDPLSARPGEFATLSIRLRTARHPIAGVQNDLEFAPGIAVAARPGNRPDCAVNPAIDKNATSFSFQPAGCAPGADCRGLRALVLSFDSSTPIADGAVLYTCSLSVSASVSPGRYSLAITNQGTSTPDGLPIAAGAPPVAVTVQGASLSRRAVTAVGAPRVCSSGSADGMPCADDADCPLAICVVAQGVCDGGDDDGLLCDCPGGVCRAGGSSCGGGPDAGVCDGGAADGACCDRSFTCRNGSACTASQRLCASGPAKGSPCLNDAHCLGGACLVSSRRCVGGEFDGIGCIDAADCPAASCIDPHQPTPTATEEPTQWITGLRASNSDGCAVVAPRDRAAGWWLLPALLLVARRRCPSRRSGGRQPATAGAGILASARIARRGRHPAALRNRLSPWRAGRPGRSASRRAPAPRRR